MHDKKPKKAAPGSDPSDPAGSGRHLAGLCAGGGPVSIPKPPCDPRCARRSPTCHDRETCPDWARYQDALAAYNEAVRTAKRGEVDYTSARKVTWARMF